jgi:predicted membrane channel-forming protein YqfA (hemolysin III family)
MAGNDNERLELFGRRYDLLLSFETRRFAFLYGAIGAADFAVLYLFFSPGLTGLRLDTGARVVLYLTVTSLGLVILSIALGSLTLPSYQRVAPYIFVAGALCTAVAVELLLAQLDPGACLLLLPWLVMSAVVIAVPAIWHVNQADVARRRRAVQAAIITRWRHILAR